MSATDELAEAQAKAEAARQRLTGTMVDMQARLNPKAIAREAVQDLRDAGETLARNGIEAARKRPAAVAGIVGALALVLARRPIARLFGRKSETRSHKRR